MLVRTCDYNCCMYVVIISNSGCICDLPKVVKKNRKRRVVIVKFSIRERAYSCYSIYSSRLVDFGSFMDREFGENTSTCVECWREIYDRRLVMFSKCFTSVSVRLTRNRVIVWESRYLVGIDTNRLALRFHNLYSTWRRS